MLLASHTGSGKTLAYLLPLVSPSRRWRRCVSDSCLKDFDHSSSFVQVKLLKEQEAGGAVCKPRRPRALILGPTRELTDQILTVAKGLSHFAKFRSMCANGGILCSLFESIATTKDTRLCKQVPLGAA